MAEPGSLADAKVLTATGPPAAIGVALATALAAPVPTAFTALMR